MDTFTVLSIVHHNGKDISLSLLGVDTYALHNINIGLWATFIVYCSFQLPSCLVINSKYCCHLDINLSHFHYDALASMYLNCKHVFDQIISPSLQ